MEESATVARREIWVHFIKQENTRKSPPSFLFPYGSCGILILVLVLVLNAVPVFPYISLPLHVTSRARLTSRSAPEVSRDTWTLANHPEPRFRHFVCRNWIKFQDNVEMRFFRIFYKNRWFTPKSNHSITQNALWGSPNSGESNSIRNSPFGPLFPILEALGLEIYAIEFQSTLVRSSEGYSRQRTKDQMDRRE